MTAIILITVACLIAAAGFVVAAKTKGESTIASGLALLDPPAERSQAEVDADFAALVAQIEPDPVDEHLLSNPREEGPC